MNTTPHLADQLLRLFPTPPDSVFVAPNIPNKKLNGARSYAQLGAETPLLVFDNTVFGSAKDGVVITNLALYANTHRGRVDLAWIRSVPQFDSVRGTLLTPHGPVELPTMIGTDAQDAFVRALELIVGWNTGALVAPVDAPPVEGLLGHLVMQHLAASKLDVGARAPKRKLLNAAAACAEWLDPLGGERLVAYGDETVMGKGDEFVALTDRRLLARLPGEVIDVPYARVLGARADKGTLGYKLVIDTVDGPRKLVLAQMDGSTPAIAGFLNGVAALPYEQRWSPPPALATPGDPSGAAALAQRLPVPDPRLPVLLRLVQAGLAGGAMSVEAARDHVERVRLFAANAAAGRGSAQGMRVSPLHGEDLAVVLGEALGQPAGVAGDHTTRMYDYRLVSRGSAAGAAASTAVGLAALAIVGVGWVSRPGSRTTLVRVAMRHLGSATGFAAYALSGAPRPLAEVDAELFGGMLATLADAEPVVILGRVLWGWHAHATSLLATPPGAFMQRVSAAIGPVDLSPFFAAQA